MCLSKRQRRRVIFIAILGGGFALLYTVGLVLDWPSWLRGVNWTWRRTEPPFSLAHIAWLIALFAVWLGVIAWLVRRRSAWPAWQTGLFLSGVACLALLAQLAIARQHWPQPLAVSFMSTVAPIGFFHEGMRIEDPVAFVQAHPEQMANYSAIHMQTQPPGWSLAFWGTWQLWQRFPKTADRIGQYLFRTDCLSPQIQHYTLPQIASAVLQMSILLWSALSVFPLYALGRDLFSLQTGRLAAVVYALLPGLLVFQARFDALYAVWAITALWLGLRHLKHGRWVDQLLLAGLLAGASLFGFGTLAIIGLVDAFMLLYVWLWMRSRRGWRRLVQANGVILLSLGLLWGGLWLVWRVSWPAMLWQAIQIHEGLRVSYPLWPLFNLYDLSVFLGWSLMAWAIAGGVTALWRLRKGLSRPGDAFMLGWLLFMLVFDLSGAVRAETGRLWLFIAVPGLLIGVAALVQAEIDGRFRGWLIGSMLVLFGMQALVIGYNLGGRMPRPVTAPVQRRLPDTAEPVSYRLGDFLVLEGYEVAEVEEGLEVTFYWRVPARITVDTYSVFVHLLANGREVVAQSDNAPAIEELPVWCRVPGEIMADRHLLKAPLTAAQPYLLGVGIYDWQTGIRLPVEPASANQVIHLPLPSG